MDKKRSESILESFKTNKSISQSDGLMDVEEKLECTVLCAVNKISIGFDSPDIMLGVLMRKTAVRSLYYQQVGRMVRTHELKDHAKILDLAGLVSDFGYHDEVYEPPPYGDKEQLAKVNEKLSARELSLIVGDEPTEITRDMVNVKVEELNRKRKKMHELWTHSSYVAAISAVLAHKTPGFDPDKAMLAGLIHDIGIVPILAYADKQPDILANPKDLAETVRKLRIEIGVQILRKWDFHEDFENVITHSENWFRDESTVPDYADIVMVSQLHSYIGKIDPKKMPKLDELPAYKKLVSGRLDADVSINILDQAKDEINDIQKLLI